MVKANVVLDPNVITALTIFSDFRRIFFCSLTTFSASEESVAQMTV